MGEFVIPSQWASQWARYAEDSLGYYIINSADKDGNGVVEGPEYEDLGRVVQSQFLCGQDLPDPYLWSIDRLYYFKTCFSFDLFGLVSPQSFCVEGLDSAERTALDQKIEIVAVQQETRGRPYLFEANTSLERKKGQCPPSKERYLALQQVMGGIDIGLDLDHDGHLRGAEYDELKKLIGAAYICNGEDVQAAMDVLDKIEGLPVMSGCSAGTQTVNGTLDRDIDSYAIVAYRPREGNPYSIWELLSSVPGGPRCPGGLEQVLRSDKK